MSSPGSVTGLPRLPFKVTNESGSETVLFIHGWPDDGSMWDRTVAVMSKEYRCVTTTLPLFEPREVSRSRGYSPWGYDFDDMVQMIRNLVIESSGDKMPIILAIFDWGAAYGFMYEKAYPEDVSRVIAMDIGPFPPSYAHPKAVMTMIGAGIYYQYRLILCFLLGKIPGLQSLADRLAHRAIKRLASEAPLDRSGITADAGFGYLYMHLAVVKDVLRLRRPKPKVPLSKQPNSPCLFFYGTKKKRQFFSPKYGEALQARTDGSELVPMEAVHWMMISQEEAFLEKTMAWLAKTRSSAAKL